MKTLLRCAGLLLTIIVGVHSAYATTFTFAANGPATPGLSGPNEPTTSAGIGTALVTWNDVTHIMTINVSFSGLTPFTVTGAPSGTTAAHIHCCVTSPGTAGVATQTPTFINLPLGVLSGSFSQSLDMSLASSYNPAFITANGGTVAGTEAVLLSEILSGRTYFNIHTTAFPGGEIRGFLTPAPEPTTLPLLGTGLLALAAIVRRKLKR